ncbi:MAG: C-terminal binding protein [Pseudomonadales bacterium]|nr:C-terminal binding protein [Pseudomonadales bacterium]
MKIAVNPGRIYRFDLFTGAGYEVVEGQVKTEDDMIELMHDVDGAQVGVMPLTSRRVLEACPKLKVVSRFGVGVDSIDLQAATELGILVCNVPGSNTSEVADHAIALLLNMTRALYDSIRTTKQGAWADDPKLTGQYYGRVRRIAGHTVGIIGFGNIGRAFANRVRGFGPAEIVAYDPYVQQLNADVYGVRMVELDELLSQSDYITIHTSATEETRHLINAETLKRMKSTAILVNTARGPIVDGNALAYALQNGELEAAALDVTEVEPVPSNSRLLSLDNCIVTPHTAGFSPTFLADCAIRQAENIIFPLSGRAPHGLANPEVIKTIAVMRATNPGRWQDVADFSTALRL